MKHTNTDLEIRTFIWIIYDFLLLCVSIERRTKATSQSHQRLFVVEHMILDLTDRGNEHRNYSIQMKRKMKSKWKIFLRSDWKKKTINTISVAFFIWPISAMHRIKQITFSTEKRLHHKCSNPISKSIFFFLLFVVRAPFHRKLPTTMFLFLIWIFTQNMTLSANDKHTHFELRTIEKNIIKQSNIV